MGASTLRHVVCIVLVLCMGVLYAGDMQEKHNISASVSICSGSKPSPSSMWSSDVSKSVKLRAEFTVIRALLCCLVIATVALMRRLFSLKRVSASNNISNNLPCQRVNKDGPSFLEKGSDCYKENSLEKQMMANNSSAIPKETISGGGDSKRSSPHAIRHHRRSHSTSSIFSSDKRETSSATESLRLIEEEMKCRTKIVESEKNDLQQALEKEIDRRSNEWASMLEKIRSEERRMRKRVQNLAEHNVQLQKEVKSLNNQRISVATQVSESVQGMNDLRMKLGDAENEIMQLRESLSESVKKTKQAEDGLDLMQRNYREKERENSELQKSVLRLQRLCRHQERTIGGLWRGLDSKINNCAQDKDAYITELQKEQLRLVCVEQALCKDLRNCRWEVDDLRHENTNLLERVRSKEKGSSIELIKLDQELWDRLDQLKVQAFPLLDESVCLAFKLLYHVKRKFSDFIPCEMNEEEHSKIMSATEQEWDHVLELGAMAQILKGKVESWKNSVWMQEEILKEKSRISYDESLKQHVENPEPYQQEQQHRESEEGFNQLKQELKAKNLLVKLLREKLHSNVADVEQLEDKVATFERSQEVLRSNIERLQGRLTFSNQKEKDLELLLGGKENTIKCLQTDLQECHKELMSLRAEIPKVSEERDGFQQDAEQLTLQNIKLIAEVGALKLRVNKLDEDVLARDGQLSILQESLKAKFCRKQ